MVRSLALLTAFAVFSAAENVVEEAMAGQGLSFPAEDVEEEMMEMAPPPAAAAEEESGFGPQEMSAEMNDERAPAMNVMTQAMSEEIPEAPPEMLEPPPSDMGQLPMIKGVLGDDPALGKAAMNVRTAWIKIKPEEVQPVLLGEEAEIAISDADRAAIIASCIAYSINSRRLEPQGPASLKYLRKGTTLPPAMPKGQGAAPNTAPAALPPYVANNILDPLSNLVRDLANQVTMLTNIVTPQARRRRLGSPAEEGNEAVDKEAVDKVKAAHFQWYMAEASKPENSGYEEQRALLKELYVDRLKRYTASEADNIFDQFTNEAFEAKVAKMDAGADKRRLAAALYESPMNKIKRGSGILEQALATRHGVEEWSPLWLDGARLFLASYDPEGQNMLLNNMREMRNEFEQNQMVEAADLGPFEVALSYYTPMEFLSLLRDVVIGESLEI